MSKGNSPPSRKRFAVVGAGWAGCSAAVELARAGQDVAIFEASRTVGGRARQVAFDDLSLDNGQHILLGAYSEVLRQMQIVGVDPRQALLRLPLQMRYPKDSGGMEFVAPRLPAPFHLLIALLRAKGLAKEDKLALARFSTTARWMDWKLNTDCSVTELLERFDQTDRLYTLMWRPLCIAALNTVPEKASAQVFLNVLRNSLGARRSASDMLIPKVNLTELFPGYATRFIEYHGGKSRYGAAVTAIERQEMHWRLAIGGKLEEDLYDGVIIATQAFQAARLLDGLVDTTRLAALEHDPITTCYLQYAPDLTLPYPFFALIDRAEHQEWAQFVFDRGQLDSKHSGLLAAVISASSDAIESGKEALIAQISRQLSKVFQRPELAHPRWTKLVTEKRACFTCTPGLARPDNDVGVAGLALAGDYTASDYPATLEAAARSGVKAAQLLLASA